MLNGYEQAGKSTRSLTYSGCIRRLIAGRRLDALAPLLALIHPSGPWPGEGYPDGVKMEPPPKLFSHQCLANVRYRKFA
jgi:hypothetical protein